MVAGLASQLEVFWSAFSQQVVRVTMPFWWKGGGVDQLNWFCACGPTCEAKKIDNEGKHYGHVSRRMVAQIQYNGEERHSMSA